MRWDFTGLRICREAVKMVDDAYSAYNSPAQSGRGSKSSNGQQHTDIGV